MPDRNQIKGFVICRKAKCFLNLLVTKGSDWYGSQAQRCGLQQ